MRWGSTLLITHPWITPENITANNLEVLVSTDGKTWLPAAVADSPFGANATFTAELPPYFNLSAYVKLSGEKSETGDFSVLPAPPTVNYAPGAYLPEDLPKTVTITSAPDTGLVVVAVNGKISASGNKCSVDIESGTRIKVSAAAVIDGITFESPQIELTYTADANLKKLAPDTIDAVIAEMTAEDKLALTGGIGGDPTVYINDGPAGATYAIPRLGIPGLVLADGPAGVRMRKNATVWLSPTGMASTWNLPLVEEVGRRVAEEATHFAVDVILAPGLNVQRNPLGGRNFEYYSEDPCVTGSVGSAYVRGVQSGGVGTSPKHLAGNDQENFRGQGNVVATERALREIYLRGFEAVSAESPWTYMCAYNAINGTLANANKWLMTDTLRNLWGYDGLVMSDWGADYDPVKSLEAQMDLGEPTRNAATALAWLNDDKIDETERARRNDLLDVAVRNMLKLILKSHAYKGAYGALQIDGSYGENGLTKADIDNRSRNFGGSEIQKASAEVNRRLAAEGFVLLKNDGAALPLASGAKISLVTSEIAFDELDVPGWYNCTASLGDIVTQGRGSAQVKFNADGGVKYAPTLREGLQNGGFSVTSWKRDGEIAGTGDLPHGEALGADQGAQIAAKESDVTAAAKAALDAGAEVFIFVMTRVSGEGQDVIPEEFALCERERSVFAPYADAFRAAGKKVVVLLNCGSAVDTTLFREKADAILDVYNPGTEGANAIADVLSGRANPSGKLTQSFPKTYNDSPSVAVSAAGHEGRNFGTNPVYYDEGVYVGYRYFDTFGEGHRVAFPFGHGLSYTTFAFSNLKFDEKSLTATVDVTNTGSAAGKNVAQLYLSASTYKDEKRPVKELRAFAKTRLLQPNETETLTLSLTLRDLQYYDDGGAVLRETVESYTDGTQWRVKSGTEFTVTVGDTSDAEILEKRGVTAKFTYK
jgi:beta-glucosidase